MRRVAVLLGLLLLAPVRAQEPAAPTSAAGEDERTRQIVEQVLKERDAKPKSEAPKAPKSPEKPKKPQDELKTKWRSGVYHESAGKEFMLRVGGVIQYDLGFFQAPELLQSGPRGTGDLQDGTALRRARIRMESLFYEQFETLVEFELANGFPSRNPPGNRDTFLAMGITDAFLTVRELPVIGNVRVGNQKEPFGLEHINSARMLEMLERSPLFDAFVPSPFSSARSPGISVFDHALDDRLLWSVGGFRAIEDSYGYGVGPGSYAVGGRLSGVPLRADDGEFLVHLGVAASHRDTVDDRVRIRTRPSVRTTPNNLLPLLTDTGDIPADSQELFGAEFGAVVGPFNVQSEYMATRVTGTPAGTRFFDGAYVMVTYFLTGERRQYDYEQGRFGRVIPLRPFRLKRRKPDEARPEGECECAAPDEVGYGAWEVVLRYSHLDTSDGPVRGGVLNGFTAGLNWFLTPNAKVQWNYDYTHRGDVGTAAVGDIHSFGMRLAFEF